MVQESNVGMPAESADSVNLYARAFDSLPAQTAIINREGRILLVNGAWAAFALENGAPDGTVVSAGANYFEICVAAMNADARAHQALTGIRSVLDETASDFVMEYTCETPDGARWFQMTVVPLQGEGARCAMVMHRDITAQKKAEEVLRERKARFRALFEKAGVGLAELSADGRFVRVNARFCAMLGRSEDDLLSKSFYDLTHPDDIGADRAHIEALRSGADDTCTMEKRFSKVDGTFLWVVWNLRGVRDAEGHVEYFVAVAEDISERRAGDDRQRTLMLEFSHRGKNLLGVVQSIASRTFSESKPLPEAREAFDGRLLALSSTFGNLASESSDGSLLETIFRNELAAFGERVQIEGPRIFLSATAAQNFALVAHELSTNAAKYGALSSPDGHVTVTWSVNEAADGSRFLLDWRENGGPPAAAPIRRGFGTTLLVRVAGEEFACSPSLTYGEHGFRYRLDTGLAKVGTLIVDSPVRRNLRHELTRALYESWASGLSASAGLPSFANFDWSRYAATGALTIARIESNQIVRFIEVGHALVERFGDEVDISEFAKQTSESLTEAYRRCAAEGEPAHEYLSFDFGDGEPVTFERLLVPFSAYADRTATHVAGIAIFSGQTTEQRHGRQSISACRDPL